MKRKSVFDFSSYKSFMAYMLSGEGRWGQLTRASEALNCQRSYLSRVISEGLHITPDHAYNLTSFWKLGVDERTYFQTLVDYERAADLQYRSHLKSVLFELKKKNESIQERIKRTSLSSENLKVSYFSTWIWSAIHFLTAIPEYQTVEAMADRIGLKRNAVLSHLKQLEAQGFVENRKGHWIYKAGEFHTPKNSPLVVLHHQNWRSRAVIDAQEFENESVHFTGVLTLSRDDLERLKSLLLTFISEANQIASPSRPEEAIALTCDLFKL